MTLLERARLKNIIILILALLNLFLLGSLALRHFRTENAQDRLAEELSQLFAADGIALDAAAIPSDVSPYARTPVRSMEEDRALAVFFLGEQVSASDEGGGIFTCRGSAGEALFRSNGSFDIRLLASGGDAEDTIRRFCSEFDYRDLSLDPEVGIASAVQYVDGCPAVDAVAVFRIDGGRLTSVSGIHLPQTSTTSSNEEPLSAATALTLFLQERRSSGAVVSAVTAVYPCYRLHTTSASPMALTPAWCVVTDTGEYYVNSITGAVTLP